jgi:DNA-binding transcriptional MerR regulator
MSKYTTGEIAKLCGVSVRTVQYYDDRNILIPSELSEGGRRLYSEEDLKRMHVICFLRDAGISIKGISLLLREEKPDSTIGLLLDEQEKLLREELAERERRLELVGAIRGELRSLSDFSFESIADIARMMKSKNKLKKMHWLMILTGIPVTALQWTAVILGITHGLWWLLAVWGAVAIPWGCAVSTVYFRRVDYICPECHEVFHPRFREAFFAHHTPRMRRLTCPVCHRRGMCVEIYSEKKR